MPASWTKKFHCWGEEHKKDFRVKQSGKDRDKRGSLGKVRNLKEK
jgi:hypothetical protein